VSIQAIGTIPLIVLLTAVFAIVIGIVFFVRGQFEAAGLQWPSALDTALSVLVGFAGLVVLTALMAIVIRMRGVGVAEIVVLVICIAIAPVSLMFLMLGETTGSILSQIDTVLSTIMMLVVIVVLVALIAMIISITLSALGVVFGEAGR